MKLLHIQTISCCIQNKVAVFETSIPHDKFKTRLHATFGAKVYIAHRTFRPE